MMTGTMLAQLLGGIGLFLLGMMLLTDGLKLAAGPALETLLSRWTHTRLRALISGVTITAMVQSSSAVTVAALGFVNAGLLAFEHAVWVIFGSNVGTTLTAWLVALLGFSIKIEAYAMPLIGCGALMHLLFRKPRLRACGTALAGFGLLFLGLAFMKASFEDAGASLGDTFLQSGSLSAVWLLLTGMVLTVAMQSSSAAIAVILTAVAGGIVPLEAGAAAVIGANIGTTSTAILASLGATANARRLAVAHVLFNLITGVVALLVLPLFMWGSNRLLLGLELSVTPAVFLAIFHTLFNLLGVILMWPLGPPMIGWLRTRFQRGSKVLSLKHVDRSAMEVPTLAINAFRLEMQRLQSLLASHIRASLLHPGEAVNSETREALRELLKELNDVMSGVVQQPLSENDSANVMKAFQSIQYAYNLLEDMDVLEQESQISSNYLTQLNDWLLGNAFPATESEAQLQTNEKQAEASYQVLKQELMRQGLRAGAGLSKMNPVLQRLSHYKRLQEQQFKAIRCLGQIV